MTRWRIALAASAATFLAATSSTASREQGRMQGTTTQVSHGVEIRLPAEWQLAAERLIPKLLQPREVLSAGTGPLPVGGGGNCGAYPMAALERMGRDDSLMTIMRRPGHPGTRWFDNLPRWPSEFELPQAARGEAGRWTSELVFRDDARLLSILVAFGQPPSRAEAAEAERILGAIRFVRR